MSSWRFTNRTHRSSQESQTNGVPLSDAVCHSRITASHLAETSRANFYYGQLKGEGLMKRLFILVGFLSLIAMPVCAPQPEQQAEPATEEAPSTEADVAAIKSIFKQFDEALIAGDLEAYLALYMEDCVVLPPNAEIITGKDGYRSYAQPIIDQFDIEETISVKETEVAGDWAFSRTSFVWRLTPKAGGETIEEVGKMISILRRQSDGSWKISRNMWNTDHAP